MNQLSGRLTVFFEDPFWVGVFERTAGGKLSACKVTFGGEPGESEVYAFILCRYDRLTFSPPVGAGKAERPKENPKRIRRRAQRLLQASGAGTKAQQALQRQREQAAGRRKDEARRRQEAEKKQQFDKRRRKKKEKHKGR